MASVFSKLNLKGQPEIAVLNAPESFEPELAALGEVAVRRSLADIESPHFVLAFVTRQNEVAGGRRHGTGGGAAHASGTHGGGGGVRGRCWQVRGGS